MQHVNKSAKAFLLLLVITGIANAKMFAQCSPTVGYTGILCNGQSIDFYIDFTQTNCGTVSNISWAFDPAPDSFQLLFGNKQCKATWSSGAPVSLTITYTSSIYGTVSTPTQYYAIGSSVQLAIDNTQSPPPYAPGGINFTATEYGVGTGANFTFSVDGTNSTTVQNSGPTVSTELDLAVGTHTVAVLVQPAAGSTCTNSVSSSLSVDVQAPAPPPPPPPGYNINCLPTVSYSGSLCTGQSIDFYADFTQTNCGTVSNITWAFLPEPDPNLSGGLQPGSKSYKGTWLNGGPVTLVISYTSSLYGSLATEQYPPLSYTITSSPSVKLRIDSTISRPPYCPSGVSFVAIGNGVGTDAEFTFSVDGTNSNIVQQSGPTVSTGISLAAGTHTVGVQVQPGQNSVSCPNPATSSIPINVLPTILPVATVTGPTVYCPNDAFPSYHVGGVGIDDNAYGTATYSWYVDGNPLSSLNNNNNNTYNMATVQLPQFNGSANVVCQVNVADPTVACFVEPSVSNTATTVSTSPVVPMINNIIADRDSQTPDYYCTGDNITFTATGSNLYGAPVYTWVLDGTTLSGTGSTIIVPTAKVASPGVFGPNSSIAVSILSGLSGACFVLPMPTPGYTRTSVALNFRPVLPVIPYSSICSGATTNISFNSDTPGTTFTWTRTSSGGVSGASNNTTPTSASVIAQTLTVPDGGLGGGVGYVITPFANGCTGSSVTASVGVNSNPLVPTFSSGGIFPTCGVSNVLLTAQVGAGGTEVHWYDASSNYLGNTNSINPYVISNVNYTALSYNATTQCQSLQATAQVILDSRYNAPVNSIIEQDALIDGMTTTSNLNSQPVQNVQEKVQYFDGLGRHYQDVMVNGSPLQNDLVQTSVYDQYGREYVKYLPVAVGSDGCPKNDIIDSNGNYTGPAQNFYNNGLTDKIADDSKPLSQTVFENSPLNRVLKQGAPGLTWQPDSNPSSRTDHTVKHSYEYNGPTDVIYFTYNPTTGLVSTGASGNVQYYVANQLQANRTTDEHQNDVIEYVDKLGHTVCKKVQYSTSGTQLFASTYYIYDDFGNLIVVLPPQAIQSALTTLTSQN